MTRALPHLKVLPVFVQEKIVLPSDGLGARAYEGISALFIGLTLIVAIPIVIFLIVKIIKLVRMIREKGLFEEMRKEAMRHEKAGEFVSAGLIHEKLKDPERAAELYEKGGDFLRAASVFDSIEDPRRAAAMLEKAGDLSGAARAWMTSYNYMEAARVFNQAGDKAGAAHALEMTGNRLAAARAYREAKDYIKASMLLKEEGLLREAADMYGISLAGVKPEESALDLYYTYAGLLEEAGEKDRAGEVLRQIMDIDPRYRDVAARLGPETSEASAPQPPPEFFDPAMREMQEAPASAGLREAPGTSLRNIMLSGSMEPRYAFRLWVQILKALASNKGRGLPVFSPTPETILINASNSVSFSEGGPCDPPYAAPETLAGGPRDEASLIFTMGVILYEMLAGGLDSFGSKTPGESATEAPPWLDDLVAKCTAADRSARYGSFADIFAGLKDLKNRT